MRVSVIFLIVMSVQAQAEGIVGQGRLLPALTIASEHRFNGMSLTDRNPALQLSLHVWRPDDYYAGIWMSNVDFRDGNDTSIEVDAYLGKNFDVAGYNVAIEGMYSAFDDQEPGPKYDFFQLKLEASKDLGNFTPRASVKFSPSGSVGAGKTWQLALGGTWALTDWLAGEVVAGRGIYEHTSERNYWEAGLTASWKTIHFDIRYVDMETDLPLCDFVSWCEPAVVGKITFATY